MFVDGNKYSGRVNRYGAGLLLGVALPVFSAVPALAQSPAGPALSPDTQQLVEFLVNKGVLTKTQANEFAEQVAKKKTAEKPAVSAAAAANPSSAAVAPSADGAIHVTYVPDIVKNKMKEELRQEVMAQAKAEHWAAPDEMPAWTKHLTLSGDVRVRYEGDFFPSGNDNTGSFPNFNAINTGNPFDLSSVTNLNFPPEFNVDQNRNRFRLRLRLGLDADLGEAFSAGFRAATGDASSPTSTNQSLGASGGNFSKYSIWLDRAWIKYTPVDDKRGALSLTLGRFANPFVSTELVFDEDLNFDGAALQGRLALGSRLTPFLTLGAFPIFNTDLNFASNQTAKFKSDDKYLFAGQLGFDWKIGRRTDFRLAAAYYAFDNVAGRLSSLCTVTSTADICDTDATRPSFAQKGNSYRALRQIAPTEKNGFGKSYLYQYFGLATGYRELAGTTRLDIGHFEPFHIIFDGEVVKNLAFDKSAIEAITVNNRGEIPTGAEYGPFEGGDMGYFGRLTLGAPKLDRAGKWNVMAAYKWVESDAVIDGFTDSDFGLGGTNLKGFIVGGSFALSSNVYTSLRWMSADSIAGPAYAVDILQFDIGTRF